jgi:TonB family protein
MKAMVIAGLVVLAAQAGLRSQDSLTAAKDLYASAAYEEALSTLTRLAGDGATAPDIARQVDEYRAFSLYALGRTREAESVAESLIREKPLKKLEAADASPRLEMMFSNVRKRLLPSLIRDRFRTARTALEQKNTSEAEPLLVEAGQMITEAEKLGVNDDGLADLRALVDGFLHLVRFTADPPASPPPAAPVAPRAVESAIAAATLPPQAVPIAPGPAAPETVQSSPAPGTAVAARVYTGYDQDVTPPVVVNQRMPALIPELGRLARSLNRSAVLDIVIDEKGDVLEASIRQSLNPIFDNLLISAAQRWKYRPAMKDGVPVRFTKTLTLLP